ncbi:hypothetical protein BH11ARM2_BH11ARM2_37540 [soil metagenome]
MGTTLPVRATRGTVLRAIPRVPAVILRGVIETPRNPTVILNGLAATRKGLTEILRSQNAIPRERTRIPRSLPETLVGGTTIGTPIVEIRTRRTRAVTTVAVATPSITARATIAPEVATAKTANLATTKGKATTTVRGTPVPRTVLYLRYALFPRTARFPRSVLLSPRATRRLTGTTIGESRVKPLGVPLPATD